jgi:hypothetical protein
MDKTKINFNCPTATLQVIDKMALEDHRDRTSMLNKIIDFYLTQHGNGTAKQKKKAGAK